jgi:uncharacterized protein DUF4349
MRARRLTGLVLALGITTGITACSADSGGSAASAPAPADVARQEGGAPAQAPDATGGGSGGSGQPGSSGQQNNQQHAPVSQPGVDRKLVRTANLELASDNVFDTTNRARDIAGAAGGFAGKEEVRADSATITLHIPSDRFDKAVADLSGLVPADRVLSRSQTAEDVTEQLVDVESRIATQRASVDRVRALLARAGTVAEIVQIESEVTRREADLESLEKRREALAGQVAVSTVTVRVSKGAPAPQQPPAEDDNDGLLGGLADGWHAFLVAGGATLQVLGAVLPFAVALGVPGYFLARWWLRRRRTIAPAPAVQGQQATT